jgi:hypothetical protein
MSGNTKTILGNYKNLEKDKEERIKKVVEEYSSESEMDEEESVHYENFAKEGRDAIKVIKKSFLTHSRIENMSFNQILINKLKLLPFNAILYCYLIGQ